MLETIIRSRCTADDAFSHAAVAIKSAHLLKRISAHWHHLAAAVVAQRRRKVSPRGIVDTQNHVVSRRVIGPRVGVAHGVVAECRDETTQVWVAGLPEAR